MLPGNHAFANVLASLASVYVLSATFAIAQSFDIERLAEELIQCRAGQDCVPDLPSRQRKRCGPMTSERPTIVIGTEAGRKDIEQRMALGLLPGKDADIYFLFNSTEIEPASRSLLDGMGKVISNQTGPRKHLKLALIGHADAKGSAVYNQSLSERRARAVATYFNTKFSIDASRLDPYGRGLAALKHPERPFAAGNRRVQVVNLGPMADAQEEYGRC